MKEDLLRDQAKLDRQLRDNAASASDGQMQKFINNRYHGSGRHSDAYDTDFRSSYSPRDHTVSCSIGSL